MTHPILTPLRLENGIWQGLITSSAEPHVSVHYRDEVLDGVTLTASPDGWALAIPVPNSALSDGVHSFVILDRDSSEKLGDFTIIAGVPAADDLRAEIDLLRAELDLLKRAFRRSQHSDT